MGMSIYGVAKARRGSISAVITRADGSTENRGLIAYHHRNPLRRWPVNAWLRVKASYWHFKDWRAGRLKGPSA